MSLFCRGEAESERRGYPLRCTASDVPDQQSSTTPFVSLSESKVMIQDGARSIHPAYIGRGSSRDALIGSGYRVTIELSIHPSIRAGTLHSPGAYIHSSPFISPRFASARSRRVGLQGRA